MVALLFGSISTLADTSELQRDAFNRAFAEHGLDWNWSQDEYRSLLDSSGGAARIEAYAQGRGESVDAAAVHRTKSDLFQQSLASSTVTARPGVVQTLQDAKAAGYKVGFITTTSPDNVSALLSRLEPEIGAQPFDLVLSSADVESTKPDPAVYKQALDTLGQAPDECVAVEDNPGGAQAAAAAGIPCIAFPNENTAALDFGTTQGKAGQLDLAIVEDALARA